MPPHAVEEEMAVLGCMLIDRDAVNKAVEILDDEDFYKRTHRLIFQAILHLDEKGSHVDYLTVSDQLEKMGVLEETGGAYYLTQLANCVPSAARVVHYARIVSEKSLIRRLIEVSNEITAEAYEAKEEALNLIDQAERKIFALSENKLRKGFQSIEPILHNTFEIIEGYHAREGSVTGVATGFRRVDELTSGFQNSDLIILAARPSMGKTAFCLNMARNAAVDHNIPVGVFSLEMSNTSLAMRMLCSEAKVDAHKVRTGVLPPGDWEKLSRSVGKLADAPIHIDDSAALSVLEIRAKARRLKAEKNIGLLVIDYLQLIRGPSVESRQIEISLISQSLKALAKELDIPVLALSQLSRAVESRTDRRPILSDLRESGAIEQDADLVMFIYRADAYATRNNPPAPEDQGVAEIIIAKQRNGPTDTVKLAFQKEYVLFANLDVAHGDPFAPDESF
jgi:replicative DNA helicase